MNKIEQMYKDAIIKWRNNRGCGTLIVPHPLDKQVIILDILVNMYVKNPDIKALVIVNNWNTRLALIDYLTHQDCEENNEEFKDKILKKNIVIITENLATGNSFRYSHYDISIMLDVFDPDSIINTFKSGRFTLAIFGSMPVQRELSKVAPILPVFSQQEFDELRVSTPVEEMIVGMTIPEDSEDYKLLDYYKQYITISMDIFGSFDVMQEARLGNTKFNISATQICEQIAQENGWNAHLDMSVPINVQLDEVYNPGSIRERANKTFEIIRSRNQLLSDYKGKLEEIYKIVKEHEKERILIINKKGIFAAKVTEYLNEMFGTVVCGNYHESVDNIPELDSKGNPVLFKSGQKIGKPKMLGATSQKSRNMQAFNEGYLHVLSTNNAPDKKLSIDVDVIIITSPQCETIENYMYRLSGVFYPNNKIKLYTLYVKNSMEDTKLQHRTIANSHIIVNKCENEVVYENNSDFVVID